jgi:hypothetical protein
VGSGVIPEHWPRPVSLLPNLRLAPTVADQLHIEGRRRHPGLGLGVALATLCLSYVALFWGQVGCNAENSTHTPATCSLIPRGPSVFPFVPAFLSLAIFLFSLTPLPPRVLVVGGGLVATFYVGWLLSLMMT